MESKTLLRHMSVIEHSREKWKIFVKFFWKFEATVLNLKTTQWVARPLYSSSPNFDTGYYLRIGKKVRVNSFFIQLICIFADELSPMFQLLSRTVILEYSGAMNIVGGTLDVQDVEKNFKSY